MNPKPYSRETRIIFLMYCGAFFILELTLAVCDWKDRGGYETLPHYVTSLVNSWRAK